MLSKEHYNRLVRMCEAGEKVKMAVDLKVQFHDEDLMSYNTVAEIPGTDLKQELVMLGGHMDSWHSGTGATDNGAGVSVGMEAVRILKALDLKPRRTIRIALWSGEEQGLLGSRAFVKEHFGRSPANMFGRHRPPQRPAGANGNGATKDRRNRPRPITTTSRSTSTWITAPARSAAFTCRAMRACRPIFRKWLNAVPRDGCDDADDLANTGGTDHQSFDGIGLPGFQFIQDEIEYDSRTHHSNQDVFDRIQGEDMKQAAVIMAAFVYNAATIDQKIPRKPPATSETRGTTASLGRLPLDRITSSIGSLLTARLNMDW